MKVVLELVNDDWTRLRVDGEVFHEGHSIPDHEYLRLLKQLGCEVEETSVQEEV